MTWACCCTSWVTVTCGEILPLQTLSGPDRQILLSWTDHLIPGSTDSTLAVLLKDFEEIQGPHIFFFTLLVMLGNYEPTCIVTIFMVIM